MEKKRKEKNVCGLGAPNLAPQVQLHWPGTQTQRPRGPGGILLAPLGLVYIVFHSIQVVRIHPVVFF